MKIANFAYMKIFLPILILGAALSASAQTDPDSLAVKMLDEVVVKGATVVRKANFDSYRPRAQAKEMASDGLTLLANMQIPGIIVNSVMGTVTVNGSVPQIRINGREAQLDELRTLLPQSIVRVEYHENPGLRYGDAPAVLDFIVRNRQGGGSFMANGLQLVSEAFGNFMADVKINFGRSQWELSAPFQYRNHINIWRTYSERFTMPDGTVLNRHESPRDGSFTNPYTWPQLSYSYVNPDHTTVYASLRYSTNMRMRTEFNGMMSLDDGSPDRELRSVAENPSQIFPQLNFYLEQNLGRNQRIAVDANLRDYHGNSRTYYTETAVGAASPLIDIYNSLKDRSTAYGLQANYIKAWGASELTAGAEYSGSRTKTRYLTAGDATFRQSVDNFYTFAEVSLPVGPLRASAGAGIAWRWQKMDQGPHDTHFSVRPRLSLSYRPNSTSMFRFNLTSFTVSPSLSERTGEEQQIDGFQWQRGNEYLNAYQNWRTSLSYNFSSPRLNGQLAVGYDWAQNPVMQTFGWEGDRLIMSWSNYGHFRNFYLRLMPSVEIVPEWINLSGTLSLNRFWSKGLGYNHCRTFIGGDASLTLTHWNFSFTASINTNPKRLFAETVTSADELFSSLQLGYRWRHWLFNLGVFTPVGHYSQWDIQLNRYAWFEQCLRTKALERAVFVSVGYNITWGKQRQRVNKLVNGNVQTESSEAAGR